MAIGTLRTRTRAHHPTCAEGAPARRKRSEHDAGRRHSPASKVAVVWNEHTYHKSVSYSSAFRARKIIYQEDDDDEEEVVYVKKTKPKPQQESLEKTLYKSSQETLFNRAIEERIRANLTGYYSAMMPREY